MQVNPSDSINTDQSQSDWDNAFTGGHHNTFHKSTTQRMKEKEQRDLAAAAESNFNHSFYQGMSESNEQSEEVKAEYTKLLEEEIKE